MRRRAQALSRSRTDVGGCRETVFWIAWPKPPPHTHTPQPTSQIANFLAGGSVSRLLGAEGPAALAELLPLLPGVATQMAPEIARKLFSRISARALREVFV